MRRRGGRCTHSESSFGSQQCFLAVAPIHPKTVQVASYICHEGQLLLDAFNTLSAEIALKGLIDPLRAPLVDNFP
jgi:hypothetical protein